jgi:hypothetical protein
MMRDEEDMMLYRQAEEAWQEGGGGEQR